MNDWILACPHCGQALTSSDHKRWQCSAGHSFDRARQGYLNLLAVQHKRSRQPGDSADMVKARSRVLDSGLYQPISDALEQKLGQATDVKQLADIGCGEGYYTARLAQALKATTRVYGVDISKDAVKAAAKRSQQICWLVASGAQLPLLPGQLDAITCLFTRLMPQQFANALKPEGEVFILSTGDQHLLQLRQALYPQVKASGFDPERTMTPQFELLQQQQIQYQVEVPQALLHDLIMMTPHYWRTSSEARDALVAQGGLTVDIDVRLHHFRRRCQTESSASYTGAN